MDSIFFTYCELGLRHILDVKGYDHILFVMVMACSYSWLSWKKAVGMVTAFTLGHSVTLVWCVVKGPLLPIVWVEALIPLTIIANCVANFFGTKQTGSWWVRYVITALFGLVHGMGFSNFLKEMLEPQAAPWRQLLAFNLGVEIGQIVVVLICLALGSWVIRISQITIVRWSVAVSLYCAGAATVLLLDRL